MGQWPPGLTLPWYLDAANVDAATVAAAAAPIAYGIGLWETVAGVSLPYVTDSAQARLIVRFVLDLADDPTVPENRAQQLAWLSGVELGLTDEPLSVSTQSQLVMRLNPNPAGGWTVRRLAQVALHECGHFLGLDHMDGPSCMEAYLDESIDRPQPADVAQAQARYGLPAAA